MRLPTHTPLPHPFCWLSCFFGVNYLHAFRFLRSFDFAGTVSRYPRIARATDSARSSRPRRLLARMVKRRRRRFLATIRGLRTARSSKRSTASAQRSRTLTSRQQPTRGCVVCALSHNKTAGKIGVQPCIYIWRCLLFPLLANFNITIPSPLAQFLQRIDQ